jgi:hypothetical protein
LDVDQPQRSIEFLGLDVIRSCDLKPGEGIAQVCISD